MPLTTERGEFPYPEIGDPDNPPSDIQALANRLAAIGVLFEEGTTAARAALTIPDDGGIFYWSNDDDMLSYGASDGWHDIWFDLSGFLTIADALTSFLLQSDAASTYMPKGGGSFTGAVNHADNVLQRPEIRDAAETCIVVAATGATEDLDYTAAAVYQLTLDQNVTLAFLNPPATGKSGAMLVYIIQPAALKTVAWPASVKWPSGVAPTFAVSTVNAFSFETHDAGATWRCVGYTLDIH